MKEYGDVIDPIEYCRTMYHSCGTVGCEDVYCEALDNKNIYVHVLCYNNKYKA